jgi:hypothetical protein
MIPLDLKVIYIPGDVQTVARKDPWGAEWQPEDYCPLSSHIAYWKYTSSLPCHPNDIRTMTLTILQDNFVMAYRNRKNMEIGVTLI